MLARKQKSLKSIVKCYSTHLEVHRAAALLLVMRLDDDGHVFRVHPKDTQMAIKLETNLNTGPWKHAKMVIQEFCSCMTRVTSRTIVLECMIESMTRKKRKDYFLNFTAFTVPSINCYFGTSPLHKASSSKDRFS